MRLKLSPTNPLALSLIGVALSLEVSAAVDYRPETWFHIIGGNASKEGIVADVKALAAAGMGGIQFFHGQFGGVWPGVKEPIPCLSPKWDDLVGFLADECGRNGLSFKMQNCPGWSMSGGPWIDLDHCMRKLVCFEPGRSPSWDADDDYREIGAVTFPCDGNGDGSIRSVILPPARLINRDWLNNPDITFTLTVGGRRIFSRRCPQDAWQGSVDTMTFATEPFLTNGVPWELEVRGSHACAPVTPVFSMERKLDDWEAKAGWELRDFTMSTNAVSVRFSGTKTLVFGHVNAKRRNHPAPPEGTGWECDKMDSAGFTANWNGYLGRLLKGPLAGGKLNGTLVDSWECLVQTWTPKMEVEFGRRNGYDLRPWLPALFGYVLKSEAETERFLLDWRRTCSALVEENYFGTIARLAHENGMSVQYETAFGDVVPGDLMKFWKYADEPMCEFWGPFDDSKGYVTSHDAKPVRPCVSAAHVYGKRRVSAEAFTSFELSFDESMQELKENANRHFARGVTHLVFHTYTHNPIVGGLPPGSSFGCKIGTPFLRLQTWWPYMPQFTAYLTECCRELERGKPVVDILWYLGDALSHKPSERTDLFGGGYKYDYLNRDGLMSRVDVRDGRIVLPDGMSYRMLWIPEGTYLHSDSEKRISELEQKGARIVRGALNPDWEPQLSGGDVFWYERQDGGEYIYFIAAKDRGFRGNLKLRDVPGVVWLDLARGESRFIRSSESLAGPDERSVRALSLDRWSLPIGAWKDLPGTAEEKAFSGTRAYKTRIACPSGAGRIVLDLGRVRDWATVRVNGIETARLWCEPYRCDITDAVGGGESEIVVEVTSTWYNRLVYDAGLPEKDRKTWTIAGPERSALLRDSGLIGPVRLLVGERN